MAGQWNRLPRAVVAALSPVVFKRQKRLDVALADVV